MLKGEGMVTNVTRLINVLIFASNLLVSVGLIFMIAVSGYEGQLIPKGVYELAFGCGLLGGYALLNHLVINKLRKEKKDEN